MKQETLTQFEEENKTDSSSFDLEVATQKAIDGYIQFFHSMRTSPSEIIYKKGMVSTKDADDVFMDDKFSDIFGETPQLKSPESSETLIREQLKKYLKPKFQIIVLGATNAGKSTFLNHLLGIKGFLNVNELRETSTFWKIKFSDKSD